MRTITLNEQQQRAVEILTRLQAEALDVATAGELLGVSVRQVRRLRAAFRQEGMAAVIHGNCGRQPVNGTDAGLVERLRTTYDSIGHSNGRPSSVHLWDLRKFTNWLPERTSAGKVATWWPKSWAFERV